MTGIVEPEDTSSIRQRLRKQVSAATDTQASIEEFIILVTVKAVTIIINFINTTGCILSK
jgi:hypothetical protein